MHFTLLIISVLAIVASCQYTIEIKDYPVFFGACNGHGSSCLISENSLACFTSNVTGSLMVIANQNSNSCAYSDLFTFDPSTGSMKDNNSTDTTIQCELTAFVPGSYSFLCSGSYSLRVAFLSDCDYFAY